MSQPRSDFLKTLQNRGFIHQCTDLEALDAQALKGPVTAYIGFDCTADSLHVGSLVPIMLLRWLQRFIERPTRSKGLRIVPLLRKIVAPVLRV